MTYDPKADRFNPNAAADAIARQKARTGRTGKPADEPESVMDALPAGQGSWLYLQLWRRHLPGQRPQGPRQRPQ